MRACDSFYNTEITNTGAWLLNRRNRMLIRKLENHAGLTQGDRFLEIGPGKGALAEYIREHSEASYIAIEAADTGVQRLAERKVKVIHSIVPPFPIQSNSVHVVFADQVLEHMESRVKAVEFMQEAHRVVVPDGFLVVSVPDILDWGPYFYHDYTHTVPFTGRGLRTLAADTGWNILDCFWPRSAFSGLAGYFVGLIRRCIPWTLLARLESGHPDDGKFSKAYTTLLSRVTIVAQKRGKRQER